MRDAVAKLAANWREQGHQLGFGIGIAHGFATLGCIGFEGRFQYSATGTVANLASRLCDEARDGQILIDAKVHAAVEALAELELGRRTRPQGLPPPRARLQRAQAANVARME